MYHGQTKSPEVRCRKSPSWVALDTYSSVHSIDCIQLYIIIMSSFRVVCAGIFVALATLCVLPSDAGHRPPMGPYSGSRKSTSAALLDQERSRSDELIAQCSLKHRDAQLDHFTWVCAGQSCGSTWIAMPLPRL